MENLNKYIGLKHQYNGHGDYCDCLNLCKRFYKDHKWNETFSDGRPEPDTYDEYIKKEPTRIVRYLLKNFDKTTNIDELSYGDVALFIIGGEVHLGIIVNDYKLLAMQVPCVEFKTESTIYKRRYWENFFRMGFKRRS